MSCLCWESSMNHAQKRRFGQLKDTHRVDGNSLLIQLTDSGPVFQDVWINNCGHPAMVSLSKILFMNAYIVLHDGTTWYNLSWASSFVVFFVFFFQDKAQNTVTNWDMIIGSCCVCHSRECTVTHSTVFSHALQFDEVISVKYE